MLTDIQVQDYLMVKQNWYTFIEVSQSPLINSISLSHTTSFEKENGTAYRNGYMICRILIYNNYSEYIGQEDLLKQYPQIKQIIQSLRQSFSGLWQQFSQ